MSAVTASAPVPTSLFDSYHHIHFWVTNAKQAASFYIARFGFQPLAYRGLETGSRDVATHVISNNEIIFAFSSPLNPVATALGERILLTGDAVKDVAFSVKDATALYHHAIEQGAKSILQPVTLQDADGTTILSTVQTYGDITHTFVQHVDYKGAFLPGYADRRHMKDIINTHLPSPHLLIVDHIVGNQGENAMEPACRWYEKVLGFHRFWSIDDKTLTTEYSSLRSIVMSDPSDKIKMPINEPAPGKRKSQIQEFVDYHGQAGVQHIAMRVHNVIEAVKALRARGVDFLVTPKSYYDDVRLRLSKSPLKVKESLEELERLCILIDFDDQGYLLQIFTKPVEDRPTLFLEVIQREGHTGFGAGNFKALFEAIERDQASRGNLANAAPTAAPAAATTS